MCVFFLDHAYRLVNTQDIFLTDEGNSPVHGRVRACAPPKLASPALNTCSSVVLSRCSFASSPQIVVDVFDFPQGKGTTFVVYNDAKLRIFRSDTGGVVVQTKANEVVPT